MQSNAKETFEFNPEKLKKVNISEVRENSWNPKDPDSPEYEKVKKSIQINGLTQPIFVRENPDENTKYEVLDGAHRFRACFELGFEEIYIYDEGEVSDELAKTFTIWHQVQVPFEEVELAPLVVELNALDFELPYSDKEIEDFKNLADFDFENAFKDQEPIDEPQDDMKTLKIVMTADQYKIVDDAMKMVMDGDNVSAGRALELLCANGVQGYPFDGTGDLGDISEEIEE